MFPSAGDVSALDALHMYVYHHSQSLVLFHSSGAMTMVTEQGRSNEEVLFSEYRSGSERALCLLLDMYEPLIRSIARRVLGDNPPPALELCDLLQAGRLAFIEQVLPNHNPQRGMIVTHARFRLLRAMYTTRTSYENVRLPREVRERVAQYRSSFKQLVDGSREGVSSHKSVQSCVAIEGMLHPLSLSDHDDPKQIREETLEDTSIRPYDWCVDMACVIGMMYDACTPFERKNPERILCVVCAWIDGESVREIATSLGVPEERVIGTIVYLVNRCRSRLGVQNALARDEVSEYFETPASRQCRRRVKAAQRYERRKAFTGIREPRTGEVSVVLTEQERGQSKKLLKKIVEERYGFSLTPNQLFDLSKRGQINIRKP